MLPQTQYFYKIRLQRHTYYKIMLRKASEYTDMHILNSELILCFYISYSVFWWTNETINIWSHIFGFMLFAGLTFKDAVYIDISFPWEDAVLVANVLACFQVIFLINFVVILRTF